MASSATPTLLELSSRLIDTGDTETPPNRISFELSEIADGVAVVEAFSHLVAVRTGDGLVVFDSSSPAHGGRVTESLRTWTTDPINTLVYTHGHIDHVGGSRSLAADQAERGHAPIRVVGQANLAARLARYRKTNGYNQGINLRQFGGLPASMLRNDERLQRPFVPDDTLDPTVEYGTQLIDEIGGLTFEHNHALGETDDHTWTWIPEHKMITAGDQLTWVFPNCGNPQKVQRYPLEWAECLRRMAAKKPELLVPAHGLPISGETRIGGVLDTVASVLERLVGEVLDAMNTAATLDEILHSIDLNPPELGLPFLKPIYDEPEFVVHNIWRLYGGWWDGDPASLKPASNAAVATEVAGLAGGPDVVADRAAALAAAGNLRLACHLIEFAVGAEPASERNHEIRADIYRQRRIDERSLMAKGVYGAATAESELAYKGEANLKKMRITLAPEE